MKKNLLVLIFTIAVIQLSAQPWMKELPPLKSTNEQYNFYQIQEAFNAYWEGKEVEKGKGYKPFKRWEYFIEPRVYPNGDLSAMKLPFNQFIELKSTSEDNANWQFIGPSDTPLRNNTNRRAGSGRINCVAFDPTDQNLIYTGSPSGGFWKSTDGGNTWKTTTDNLMSIGVSWIAIHPTSNNIIYIATGDGDAGDTYTMGILKSTDYGETWENIFDEYQPSNRVIFRKVVINPDNPDILIAVSNAGVFKTTDGGILWTRVLNEFTSDIEFKPGNPNYVYVSSLDYSGNSAIYISTNSGDSFTNTSNLASFTGNVNRIELDVTPDNPDLVMALCSDANNDGFYGLYKSVNSGASWTQVFSGSSKNLLGWASDGSDQGGQGTYDLTLAITPDDDSTIYVGGVNIWKSKDGGKNWTLNAHWTSSTGKPYVHADHHVMEFHPITGELYSGNDGGLYKTNNGGTTWTDISDGLEILQSYKMGQSGSKKDLFLVGNQDNGTFMYKDGNWNEILGGDGMECLIAHDDENILYGSFYYGDFIRSDDGGNSFYRITPSEEMANDGPYGAWVAPFIMSPSNSSVLYAGYDEIYKTTNKGESWEKITYLLSFSKNYQHLAISEYNEDYLLAATYNKLFLTKDGGENWTTITPLPYANQASISDIKFDQYNTDLIWVTFSGYVDGQKVIRSTDGGETWEDYSAGIPNMPVNCIVRENSSNQALYLGTDLGVYYRNNTMNNWELFSNNLPNVIVTDLEIHYPSNTLRAATYGRGTWETPLNSESKTLYADFESAHQICLNGNIEFTNKSSDDLDSLRWYFIGSNTNVTTTEDSPTLSFSKEDTLNIALVAYKNTVKDSVMKQSYLRVEDNMAISAYPADSVAILKGQSITISLSGAETYLWEPSDGLDDPTASEITFQPDETISFTVTGSTSNCTSTLNVKIAVLDYDNVCGAYPLSYGENGPFSNVGATVENNEPYPPSDANGCEKEGYWCEDTEGSILENSVWFKFEAESESAFIDAYGFDSQIAIYSANSCEDILSNNYILIAAYDDHYGESENYAAGVNIENLTIGNTYFVQVDGSAGGDEGEFVINLNSTSSIGNNISLGNSYQLYPNPNQGIFTLVSELDDNTKTMISVYNTQGKLVHSTNWNKGKEMTLNISDLPNGIYYVNIQSQKGSYTKSIIID